MRLQVEAELLITTMTLGEVVKGIERLPTSQRRSEPEHWYAHDLTARFQGRIQSLDKAASYQWGKLCARLELAGTPMPAVASQIAAVCILRGAAVVRETRLISSTQG